MLDLHLWSASVNVRYVLHTPLGIYIYIILVGYISIHLCFCLSLLDYPSHLQHILLPLYAIPSPPSSFLSYLVNLYSFDDKRRNLQRQWPWQPQCHEPTTSRLVVGHVDLAFRDHDAKVTCQPQDATHGRKNPVNREEE
jgi:hypothetical protein